MFVDFEDQFVESFEAHCVRIDTLVEKIKFSAANRERDSFTRIALETQLKKKALWHQQEGKCCFCNRMTYLDSAVRGDKQLIATLEHVHCQTHGGGDEIENLKMSCSYCNNLRADMDYNEFVEFLETYGSTLLIQMRSAEAKSLRILKFLLDKKHREKKISSWSMLDTTGQIDNLMKSYQKNGLDESHLDYVKELIEENRRKRNQRNVNFSENACEAIRSLASGFQVDRGTWSQEASAA